MQFNGESAFWYSPVPQLLVDPKANRIETANSEACKFFGLELSALRQKTVSALFPECFPELVVLTEEALTHGIAWSDNLLAVRKGMLNTTRVEISAKGFEDASGAWVEFSVQNADELQYQRERAESHRHYRSGLGQWQRMAKVFQEFERENRLILDAAGEGIYGIDANGLTTFLNPAAEKILGWNAEELIGKNIHNIIHSCHVDGSHYPVNECPIYQAFREGVFNSVDKEVFWARDGRAINVDYTSTPIKDNGHVVGAVVIFRDVSEKILAQKRLLDALTEVESLKQRLEMENAYLQEEINSEFNHHQIVGKTAAIQNVIQKIELVAPTDATVMISGESGTGKELIARAIHDLSERSRRSLIRVNCAAIPADLFESEFFGHSRGAFTGATADRPGRFELADGGTLFLDEVGEIPLPLQGKLLRVLQEQQFERVGDSVTRHVNVRIIAATNKNLKQQVEAGLFREDLFFRLNVFPVESIPLRERPEDIPLLAQHFIQRAATRANKPGIKVTLGQIEKLKHYHWPGNIRELENVIERQVILARGDSVRFDDIFPHTTIIQGPKPKPESNEILTEGDFYELEKHNIILALKKCRGRIFGADGAATLLGLKPTTLTSRLKKHNIDPRIYKNLRIAHAMG